MLYKILMVDDHPSQIDGYKAILQYNNKNIEIETTTCFNCEEAYHIITNTSNPVRFDLVFLDRSLPPYLEKKIKSGEDLALLSRKHWPETKIIMLTSHAEAFILYDIVHKVRPNGLLIKSDFDGDGLLEAFDAIVEGNTYYTETVRESIKERLLSQGLLDSVDRQIITLISEGLQIKTIAETMNLSQDTIKKRKSKIKDLLGIDKGNDEDILKECRHLRLI